MSRASSCSASRSWRRMALRARCARSTRRSTVTSCSRSPPRSTRFPACARAKSCASATSPPIVSPVPSRGASMKRNRWGPPEAIAKPLEETMDRDITRRSFAATGLVTGFTLAAGPLNAAAIVTDTKGLDAGEGSVPVSDGQIPAYRARPSGKTHAPTVLVAQEIFGVHEHIKDLCRRLAHLGYYAIAPSLYARFGDPGKYDLAHIQGLVTDIVSKVPDDDVMHDLDSTVAFASGEGADTAKLAITGFCCGGRVVWLN